MLPRSVKVRVPSICQLLLGPYSSDFTAMASMVSTLSPDSCEMWLQRCFSCVAYKVVTKKFHRKLEWEYLFYLPRELLRRWNLTGHADTNLIIIHHSGPDFAIILTLYLLRLFHSPWIFWVSAAFVFFFFAFQMLELLLTLLKLRDSVLSHIWPTKAIFIAVSALLNASISFWFCLRISFSLLTLPIYSCMLWFFFPLESLAYY